MFVLVAVRKSAAGRCSNLDGEQLGAQALCNPIWSYKAKADTHESGLCERAGGNGDRVGGGWVPAFIRACHVPQKYFDILLIEMLRQAELKK